MRTASWSTSLVRLTVVLGGGAALVGCGAADGRVARYAAVQAKRVEGPAMVTRSAPAAARAADVAAPPEPSAKKCDVRLYIEQRPGHGVYSVGSGELGVAAVTVDGDNAVDGVCIKEPGKPLRLPAPIQLASPGGTDLSRFCDGESSTKTIAAVKVETCDWNGTFHASRPFSFELVTDEHERVADYVDFVRVYRNGDLMAAWNSAAQQATPHRVAIEGEPFRSRWLSVSLPPNDSAFDLRIIPHDNAVARAVDLVVRNDALLFRKKLLGAGKAGLLEAFPKDSQIRKSFECLRTTVSHVRAQVLHVTNGEVPDEAPPSCSLDLQLRYGSSLSDKYADVKQQTEKAAARAKQEADETIADAREAIEAKLPPVVVKKLEEMLPELAKQLSQQARDAVAAQVNKHRDLASYLKALRGAAPPGETDYKTFLIGAENLIETLDAELQLAFASLDEARALAIQLHGELESIAQNPDRQAQLFNVIATRLGQEGDTFEERRDNPPLDAGEQKVPMRYRDRWQFYALAPWNAVPIRTGSDSGGDLNAAVAIPLIDIFGGRYQFGGNRFSDIRAAFGIGYTSTELTDENGQSHQKAAAMPNFSIGAANLKFGVGYVTTESQKDKGFKDHIRWLVGVDLFKLISGRNVELL